ncbi:MAG TPA: DNA adenine methylase, partial [Polyangiaceae bacterium]|nr:DNA adenine methylase [Polyangiaceae bacterium]
MQARPIVKWAGGKGRLVPALRRHVPPKMRTYVEPFAGGAALFFALASETPRPFERAVLCDMNEELVACYRAVQ